MSYAYDTQSASFTVKPEWGASIKGRYGLLASPETLFYGVAGGVVAVASWGCSATGTDEECPDRMQETMYGWPLLGFGAETRIGPNWRFRYEYDVKFLPTLTFEPMTVTPLSGTANIALVRDLGGGESDGGSFGATPATWTGFYAGLALGHQMSSTRFDGSYDDATWAIDGFGASSVTGGAFGGYLHQFGPLVLGIEAGTYFDIGELGAKVDSYAGFGISAANYFQVRGRAGLVVSPATMVYGLAGWLHSDGQLTYTVDDATYTAGSFSREGYEIGGGIETWLGRHWSVRTEYSYATFRDSQSEVSDYVRMTSHVGTGTVAAVYHFGQ
jgi:outer membrane immunogenic protein